MLKPYSDALEIIKTANYQSDKEAEAINSLFRWLNQIDNFDWVPPAILYFSKNSQTPVNLKRFLTDLERLAAGLMILRADINDRIERYARLLSAIEEDWDLYALDSPLQLTVDEVERIVKTLDGDLYLIKRIRQYVLLRLDSALAQGEASYDYSVITVEHVLPQNPSEGSIWLQWFPVEEERIQYVHRIGNLALLSRKKVIAQLGVDKARKNTRVKGMKELPDLKQLTDSDKDRLIQTLWDELQKLQQKKPKKTSKNSSLPPAQGFKAAVSEPSGSQEINRSASVGRCGGGRKLTPNPDQIIRAEVNRCKTCGVSLSGTLQQLLQRYEKVEIPPIRPVVTQVMMYPEN
ncbi:HNH endonuclease [Leptothermofonsia sichuanensis E412]|uniref:HNH endonuclease family protein n=1 Tax=Leptothermofonsia sichuanensis TaxID=2917832 RepID=UPI001CA67738|nr:HNH endonuclease family protein [Leptothermofonsia sichuanensis]QZZ18954.1 HNH endonuclease [Leptothermofonsia sichuanensis E412]